ncbi:MAG: hypothetical protein ACR2GX_06550 [Candidatus Dormibacteria bacterium]
MTLSPALVLAVIFVLLGAQVTRLVLPGRGKYFWTVLLAAGGVMVGETVAVALHTGGPAIGPLHPLAEGLGVALFEGLGALLVRPPRHEGPP